MKKNLIRNSLKFSLQDGIFAAAMFGFTTNFWVACAEAIKVSALKAGLVLTLPHLISSMVQTVAEPITNRLGGRLMALKKLIAFQWVSLFPLIFLPVLPAEYRYGLLMMSAIGFALFGSLPGPAWLSLMSDHLPPKSSGKYFGWRNRIMECVVMSCGLFAGQILQFFKHRNILWGFSLIFGLSFISRVISWNFLIRMYDPPFRKQNKALNNAVGEIPDSFFKFLRNSRESSFVRFAFFAAMFTFSTNLVSPYFAIYMLRDLGFSYTTFTYVTFAATLSGIVGVKVWGELSDQFGNLRVIRATSAFIAVIPIFWFISVDPVWLVLVQVSAGFAWSGLQLCVMTFAFSEIPAAFRTRAFGYLAAMNGTALFLGSYVGGTLLNHVPVIGRSSFTTLLLISASMRVSTVLYFLKRLQETRSVLPTSTLNLYLDALGLNSVIESGKEIFEIVIGKKTK